MAEQRSRSAARIIGSRELHQQLPAILKELERTDSRYVLTVHGRPRAVLIGAESYQQLVLNRRVGSEPVVELQLSALLGETCRPEDLESMERAVGTIPGRDFEGSFSTIVDGSGKTV